MRRRAWALALALVALLSACGPGAVKEEPFIEEFLAMDTAMRLTVYGQGAGEAAGLARERVLELEALLSVTDETSDICAANRNGGGVLHAATAALLERALALCGETGGALDVSVYPVVRAWGFTTGAYRVPEEAELAALLERVDYTRISLEGTVLTLPEGMELDLGAVAKGWTGDRLMELLRREGITSAIVELGGNVQALGSKPDGSPCSPAVKSRPRTAAATPVRWRSRTARRSPPVATSAILSRTGRPTATSSTPPAAVPPGAAWPRSRWWRRRGRRPTPCPPPCSSWAGSGGRPSGGSGGASSASSSARTGA